MIKYSIFVCILPFLLSFVRREGGKRVGIGMIIYKYE